MTGRGGLAIFEGQGRKNKKGHHMYSKQQVVVYLQLLFFLNIGAPGGAKSHRHNNHNIFGKRSFLLTWQWWTQDVPTHFDHHKGILKGTVMFFPEHRGTQEGHYFKLFLNMGAAFFIFGKSLRKRTIFLIWQRWD